MSDKFEEAKERVEFIFNDVMGLNVKVVDANAERLPMVLMQDKKLVTTSRNVAYVFGKKHYHVLRAIENLECPKEFSQSNFGLANYIDEQGKPRSMFTISRDGFTLLAMGFTGKAAMKFKLAYIDAFNRMEAKLKGEDKFKTSITEADIVAALGMDQANLKNTHRVKIMEITRYVNQLDENGKRKFLLTYSQLCGIVGGGPEKQTSVISDKGVQTFFEQRCSFEGGAVTPKADLYEEYEAYATAKGFAVITRNLFFKWLYQYGGDSGVSQYHQNKDGQRVHSLRGIKLN